MRINRYLALCGVGSRRGVEAIISEGRVQIQGKGVAHLGSIVEEIDTVMVDGKVVQPEKHAYYLYHKPFGVVTTMQDPQGRPCLGDVISNLQAHVVPVGRLDYDSQGALLLTNDGEMAHRLTHPKFELEKCYQVYVHGTPSDEMLDHLRDGVILDDDYQTHPCQCQIIGEWHSGCVLEITLHEGRNRQIRRMLSQVGLSVGKLIRISIGTIQLKNMYSGEVRHLTKAEVDELKSHCGLS